MNSFNIDMSDVVEIEKSIRSVIDGRFVHSFFGNNSTHVGRIVFGDLSFSIQASEYHYCSPRANTSYYDEVEIGFPNFNFSESFINRYAEDVDKPQDTVYAYVPIRIIAHELRDLHENTLRSNLDISEIEK